MQPDISWDISVTPVYTDENDYLGSGTFARMNSICNAGSVFDEVNCDIDPGAEV